MRSALTDADVDAIHADTLADRRTIVRRLAGLPVRASLARAIDQAIATRVLAGIRSPSTPPSAP